MPSVTVLRPGQIIAPKAGIDYRHVQYGELLSAGSAFQVLTFREESRQYGRLTYCGVHNADGEPLADHDHSGIVLVRGIADWMCMDVFEVLDVVPCKHVCRPFCMCLPKTLGGRPLFHSRHRNLLPVRSAAQAAAAEERARRSGNANVTEAGGGTVRGIESMMPRWNPFARYVITSDDIPPA